MSWTLADTRLVVRKNTPGGGGGGATVSMRWDNQTALSKQEAAAEQPQEQPQSVAVPSKAAVVAPGGVLRPLPNRSQIAPGSSLVLAEGPSDGDLHFVPIQLDRQQGAGSSGSEDPTGTGGNAPPVDVRDLDSWVGHDVQVVRRLQSFRGRLLAVLSGGELVLATPTANGGEKATRLKDYESITTPLDAAAAAAAVGKPATTTGREEGQLRLVLASPARRIHLSFDLRPESIGWGVSYTAVLNRALNRVRLWRAQIEVYNRTGFTFCALPALTLEAAPEIVHPVTRPAISGLMFAAQRFLSSALNRESAAPPSASAPEDDLAGRLAMTFEVPLAGACLPPVQTRRTDGAELPLVLPLLSQTAPLSQTAGAKAGAGSGVRVEPFFVANVDPWASTAAGRVERGATPAALKLRLTNDSAHDWAAGPLRIFAGDEDLSRMRLVSSTRLPDARAGGGSATITLARSSLVSYRARVSTTSSTVSAPIGAGGAAHVPIVGPSVFGTSVGGPSVGGPSVGGPSVGGPSDSGGAARYVPHRGFPGRPRRRPSRSIPMAAEAAATADIHARRGGDDGSTLRHMRSDVYVTFENADVATSRPVEVHSDLYGDATSAKLSAPPSLSNPAPMQQQQQQALPAGSVAAATAAAPFAVTSPVDVSRDGRTLILRLPPIPPRSRVTLHFALAYDAPIPALAIATRAPSF